MLRAHKRDTVASIARRYRVSPEAVAAWNDVSSNARFKTGQRIVLHLVRSTQAKRPAGSKVRAASTAHKPSRSAKASNRKSIAKKSSAKTPVAAKKSSTRVAKRGAEAGREPGE